MFFFKVGDALFDHLYYEEMYLIMARAAEKAERILIEAQRKCEELYMERPSEEGRPSPAGLPGEE